MGAQDVAMAFAVQIPGLSPGLFWSPLVQEVVNPLNEHAIGKLGQTFIRPSRLAVAEFRMRAPAVSFG